MRGGHETKLLLCISFHRDFSAYFVHLVMTLIRKNHVQLLLKALWYGLRPQTATRPKQVICIYLN